MSEFRSFLVAQVVLVVLHGLDLLTTYVAITGGHGEEANPIMAHILEQYGWPGMIATKSVLAGLFMFIAVSIKAKSKAESSHLTLDCCTFFALVLMTFVVASNAMICLN